VWVAVPFFSTNGTYITYERGDMMDRAEFRDKFATDSKWNSCKLKADGCGKRFIDKSPFRDNELRKPKDQRFNVNINERTLLNCMKTLQIKGINDLQIDESTEEFVLRHSEVL